MFGILIAVALVAAILAASKSVSDAVLILVDPSEIKFPRTPGTPLAVRGVGSFLLPDKTQTNALEAGSRVTLLARTLAPTLDQTTYFAVDGVVEHADPAFPLSVHVLSIRNMQGPTSIGRLGPTVSADRWMVLSV